MRTVVDAALLPPAARVVVRPGRAPSIGLSRVMSRVLSSALSLALCSGAFGAVGARHASAQQPAPPPPAPQAPPVAGAPYRAPMIALVQPANGGTLPQDKPVVVFRFSQGEAADPIDAGSLAVTVDGRDRTSLFRVTAAEAWGPIADDAPPLAAGPHQVTARICSTRGACAAVGATLIAVADPGGLSPPPQKRRDWLIDLVLQAARKLLAP